MDVGLLQKAVRIKPQVQFIVAGEIHVGVIHLDDGDRQRFAKADELGHGGRVFLPR